MSILERFNLAYIPEPNSGCWLWFGTVCKEGYGQLSEGGKNCHRYHRAHRLSHELFKGPVPKDMYVLHSCDMPCCVNPDHLRIGTQKDNGRDKVIRNRAAKGERQGSAKLNAEQVLEIRLDKRSPPQIAKDYGITRQQVGNIQEFRHWRHI
jgi:hypothetical protein